MQENANVLHDDNDDDDGSNPTEVRYSNDIDRCADLCREDIGESIRNKPTGLHVGKLGCDRNIRPASLPIRKCFNYTEDSAGSGKLDTELDSNLRELNQSQNEEATFLSPAEGQFWKRYAEVSKFRKDNSIGECSARNRRRSDTSFMLAKQRLSSFSLGGQGTNAETMDDDLAPLLPSKRELSQEDFYQSQTSLVSSSEGGILAEGEETSSESQVSENSRSPACVLGLVERLLRTHPVWFLPGIQRSGAVHLLQGKEEGNFIVRGSSQSKTMAVSVRLPQDCGPYIEHYLIQSNEGLLSLESSRFKFDSIPSLIAHYSQCCDELPVQLCLPKALREAKNRQQLSSLALLGQEFWRYPMASPKPRTLLSANSSHLNTPSDATHSSGIGLTFNNKNVPSFNSFGHDNNANTLGLGETPTDTISTLSSFTVGHGQQLLSPESIDSAVVCSPIDAGQTGIIGKTSTFKSKRPLPSPTVASYDVEKQIEILNANLFTNNNSSSSHESKLNESTGSSTLERQLKTPRPTPPNTLNIKPIRSPPAPPARRLKPPSTVTTPNDSSQSFSNNITVTTTVTFSVDNHTKPQMLELVSPNENNMNFATFQATSKRLPPDGECHMSGSFMKNQELDERFSDSDNNVLAIQGPPPSQPGNGLSFRKSSKTDSTSTVIHTSRTSRRSKRKESKHYQESDILESPSVYCRSNLGDKISDYEDIWTQDNNGNTTLIKKDKVSTFKPTLEKPSELLSPGIVSLEQFNHSLTEPPTPYNPIFHEQTKTSLMSSFSTENVIQLRQHRDASSDRSTPTDLHQRHVLKTFSPTATPTDMQPHNPMLEPRYRMGLCFPNAVNRCELNGNDTGDKVRAETPTLNNGNNNNNNCNKQDSPFYADPADVLNSIVRRSPLRRSSGLPSNHRHSEPPKQLLSGYEAQSPPMWASIEQDVKQRNPFAASLDELKSPRAPQSRYADRLQFERLSLEQTENNDYDNDLRWLREQTKPDAIAQKNVIKLPPNSESHTTTNNNNHTSISYNNNHHHHHRVVTVHQIIANRLPNLDLPELPGNSANSGELKDLPECSTGTLTRTQRKSAYDNVEKQNMAYASSLIDSTQSDDGTVFSEPWDSSQWDRFLPQENNADTLPMGETSNHSGRSSGERYGSRNDMTAGYSSSSLRRDVRLKKTNSSSSQKIATILRSRSCRDREVLCHPRNKTVFSGPGETIGMYALSLADDTESTFSRNILNFISCTKESKAAPQVVMRNMRQFMSGMKNYLVKHGEGDFAAEVQKARSQLKSDEFLNLDSILEEVMHRLVILPLREHLYGLFVDYYTQSGDIQLLVEKVKQTSGRGPMVFGIKNTVTPPSASALRQISTLFVRLQEAELPLEKLDLLLTAVSTIFEATNCANGQQLSADDFLPVLVQVVAHCGFIGAEIEAEYMWGLIQPSLLSGEAGYYLTALCSAVHVLKNFSLQEHEGVSGSVEWTSPTFPECSSVLRVIIPDEYNGSIQTRTLPIRPHTTTREVCRIIAHKARITNAQDYGLFKLIDGEETLLQDNECPQDVRMAACGKHCMIAYKRVDAKIAWPTVMPTTLTDSNQ
ncbi:protein sprint isoform X1 [Malaya genurostris]|uniref:protein sprint isoform X1 n=1 Tax=Malaya genurostris TaxID=325434 RepID=UPI0026F3CD8D|nr:protein sprint isoform X1 [Malaya genurostris]XP_058445673.1 protein sprint isoform X1 [Malaya genurostris]XP_058445674.1 protein sprint isoform X1 [Malaya genurostris]XP_058445675.1 protein sprint isoform X1 [Malaya genurostris]XP_058445676.1 protein sprint isoform X1 [Malaya genurostris]XP_058445677.1 protein sprint isoform X1 [Malaya genurostris]XP_058445679.1 protein sprint isoform X1 [Malaya genurostris]